MSERDILEHIRIRSTCLLLLFLTIWAYVAALAALAVATTLVVIQ